MAMTKPTSDQITFLNTVTLPGDLAVNGADITTTATGTATVFNTNATTLNVGGAATTVSLGAATGTTTINNANTVVTGDLAVNGADITTTSTGTATVFNTNATTVNVGGAATTLSLGAATGTASVNNATFQFNSGYGSVATAYGCRCWINFNGTGTPAARASGNVSSIADNGVGDYTINFSISMPDVNYCVVGMGMLNRRIQYQSATFSTAIQATNSVAIRNTDSGTTVQDDQCINVAVFR